jgi:hypothetical protein
VVVLKSSIFWDITLCSPLSHSTFQRNMSPPSSMLKSKPNKKSAVLVTCFTLVSCLAFSLILNTEVICFFKILVDFQQTTKRYISEDRTLRTLIFLFLPPFCFVLWERCMKIYSPLTLNSYEASDHIRSLNVITILTKNNF